MALPSAPQTVGGASGVALSAATGIDAKKLSEACPNLGLTGAPNTPLLYAARGEKKRLNTAVWGVENRVLSALVSAVGGGRY